MAIIHKICELIFYSAIIENYYTLSSIESIKPQNSFSCYYKIKTLIIKFIYMIVFRIIIVVNVGIYN